MPTPSPTPSASTACSDLPGTTFVIPQYGITFDCPAGFDYETFAQVPDPTLLYAGHVWDPHHVGPSGYPEGQVEIAVSALDAPDLQQWLAKHVGPPLSSSPGHYWDSTSNAASTVVAGRPAITFDYQLSGPEAPPTAHATAIDLGAGNVLWFDSWSYTDAYRPSIDSTLASMVASLALGT